MGVFNYAGYDVELEWGKYVYTDNTAINLVEKGTGELITTVTVNLEDVKVDEDIIGVKDYSENEGMVKFLIDNELIETGFEMLEPRGFVLIPYYRLTDKAKKLREEFYKEKI